MWGLSSLYVHAYQASKRSVFGNKERESFSVCDLNVVGDDSVCQNELAFVILCTSMCKKLMIWQLARSLVVHLSKVSENEIASSGESH